MGSFHNQQQRLYSFIIFQSFRTFTINKQNKTLMLTIPTSLRTPFDNYMMSRENGEQHHSIPFPYIHHGGL